MIKFLKIFRFVFLLSFFLNSCAENEKESELPVDAFSRNKLIGKGINFGNALEAPREGDWGVVIKDEYFDIVKNLGFQSVRIPIKWSAYLDSSDIIEENFFKRVDHVVNTGLKNGLAIIVNVHHFDEIHIYPDLYEQKLYKIWKQIAKRYKNHSSALFYELLNEPNANLTVEKWNKIFSNAIDTIRKYDDKKTILVSTAIWSSVWGFHGLKVPEDKNVIVTFHFYDPFEFTHQGAEWVSGSDKWLGRKWPESEEDIFNMKQLIQIAIDWSKQNNIPLHCGEFGAYYKADSLSRVLWTEKLVDILIENEISFSYWEFCAGFGIYNPKTNKFDFGLIQALTKNRKKIKGGEYAISN